MSVLSDLGAVVYLIICSRCCVYAWSFGLPVIF